MVIPSPIEGAGQGGGEPIQLDHAGAATPPGLALGRSGHLRLRLALGPDALQQHRRRLVVGVLGHQPAGERLLEDALPQPLRPGQAGLHRRLRLLHHRQPPLHLRHDAPLLG